MPRAAISDSDHVGMDLKQYAAGGPYNLVADGGTGCCARLIVMIGAGDLSACVNAAGVDRPQTGLVAGERIEADIQSVTSTAAFRAYW
jgi:hypothetical protein